MQDDIVAMIDDGTMCVDATVESVGSLKLPVPGITGCRRYFKEDDQNKKHFDAIKDYFLKLDRQIFARFDNFNAALVSIQTVYGISESLLIQPPDVAATRQRAANNWKLKCLAFWQKLIRFFRGVFIS